MLNHLKHNKISSVHFLGSFFKFWSLRMRRFYWTGARLSDLNGLVAEGKNSDKIVRFFHITVEEVQNGWTKLIARVRRAA
jgi:hypothetical protein